MKIPVPKLGFGKPQLSNNIRALSKVSCGKIDLTYNNQVALLISIVLAKQPKNRKSFASIRSHRRPDRPSVGTEVYDGIS